MIPTVFCLDFDETLSNTDRLREDLTQEMRRIGGDTLAAIYLESYEAVRHEHGAVRMPLVLKAMANHEEVTPEIHHQLATLLHNHPYDTYLYPGAEQVIASLKEQGKVIIFSDGDSFFQPQKIYATPTAASADAVIILPDKTRYFADLEGYYPAEKYVFIDDKQRVLDAAKQYFGKRCTTILVQQGRYTDSSQPSTADFSVTTIGEAGRTILIDDRRL